MPRRRQARTGHDATSCSRWEGLSGCASLDWRRVALTVPMKGLGELGVLIFEHVFGAKKSEVSSIHGSRFIRGFCNYRPEKRGAYKRRPG